MYRSVLSFCAMKEALYVLTTIILFVWAGTNVVKSAKNRAHNRNQPKRPRKLVPVPKPLFLDKVDLASILETISDSVSEYFDENQIGIPLNELRDEITQLTRESTPPAVVRRFNRGEANALIWHLANRKMVFEKDGRLYPNQP